MPVNPIQAEKSRKLKEKAKMLYKQGLTTREVGAILKRSHQWVALAVADIIHSMNEKANES